MTQEAVRAWPPRPSKPAPRAVSAPASRSSSLASLASASDPVPARPTNLPRSLFHFSAALVGLVTVALFRSYVGILVIAVVFATYCWTMEIVRRVHPPFNDHLMRLYGPIAHAHERHAVNSATWYATALVLLATLSARPATMAALAVLGVADPIAAFVGRRWGKHVLRAGRSLEGAVAFFVSGALAAAVALVTAGGLSGTRVVLLALLAGLVGALAELLAKKLDDNLTIPLSVGAALTAALVLTA